MNTANRSDCIVRGVGWMVGAAVSLVFTALAIAFFGELLLV